MIERGLRSVLFVAVLQRRELAGGIVALVSRRVEADGFLVAFTERTGGASAGAFSSLNLGGGRDRRDRVVENRRRLAGSLGFGGFACAEQIHGRKLARVGPARARAGFDDSIPPVSGADGLVTSSTGVALAVFGADCLLVALVDPSAGAVAAFHAGWRGIAAGMIEASLAAFEKPARIRAVIGPAIGPDHYEVGEDVAFAVASATRSGAVTRRAGPRIWLDLPGTVARILRDAGVKSIERASECTACEEARFFSHRRDGVTGRQALVVGRLP